LSLGNFLMNYDWIIFEKIVHLIERSISPDSVVKHNVNLPVIGSPSGRTRQCDVVIWSGQKPRETITIVEVQKRKSKLNINTFGGWLEKLEEVGAQYLICVSRHDFPTSIKEKAVGLGSTVRLITLKELNTESIPININFTHSDFDLKKVNKFKLTFSNSEIEELGIRDVLEKDIKDNPNSDVNENFLSLDKNKLVSMYLLCRDHFVRPDGESEGEGRMIFDIKESPELYIKFEDHFLRVGLDCKFLWTYKKTEIPISVLTYEQNEAGVLAWVAEVSYECRAGLISTKFPIVKKRDGQYRVEGMFAKLPPGICLSIVQRTKPRSSGEKI
jgi:hypothetical protein